MMRKIIEKSRKSFSIESVFKNDEELKTRIETHEKSRYEYSISVKDRIIKDSMYIKDKALIQEIANYYNEVSKNV